MNLQHIKCFWLSVLWRRSLIPTITPRSGYKGDALETLVSARELKTAAGRLVSRASLSLRSEQKRGARRICSVPVSARSGPSLARGSQLGSGDILLLDLFLLESKKWEVA